MQQQRNQESTVLPVRKGGCWYTETINTCQEQTIENLDPIGLDPIGLVFRCREARVSLNRTAHTGLDTLQLERLSFPKRKGRSHKSKVQRQNCKKSVPHSRAGRSGSSRQDQNEEFPPHTQLQIPLGQTNQQHLSTTVPTEVSSGGFLPLSLDDIVGDITKTTKMKMTS